MSQQRLAPIILRARAAFPAVAFFGGFFWDAATLGRSIQSLDLFILLAYLAAAGALLVWMGRRGAIHQAPKPEGEGLADGPSAEPPGSAPVGETSKSARILEWVRADGPAFALQFLFGSLFSALVIFYFLSSSYLPGFLMVLALVSLLVLNEFLESHYHRFTITWTLYGICAILFANFALPHLVHSIHPAWFFVSTGLGVGLIFGIRALSPRAQGALWPVLVAAGVLVLLYLGNAIPPVPLVKKNIVICRNLEHTEGVYTGEIQKPSLLSLRRTSESVVRRREGEKVYCFTSVWLPTGIRCTLYHRWRRKDPRTGDWVESSRIGFPVSGGRKDGFRGYTYKRNLGPGRWEVRVETGSERVIGVIHFRVETSADTAMVFKKLVLE